MKKVTFTNGILKVSDIVLDDTMTIDKAIEEIEELFPKSEYSDLQIDTVFLHGYHVNNDGYETTADIDDGVNHWQLWDFKVSAYNKTLEGAELYFRYFAIKDYM